MSEVRLGEPEALWRALHCTGVKAPLSPPCAHKAPPAAPRTDAQAEGFPALCPQHSPLTAGTPVSWGGRGQPREILTWVAGGSLAPTQP